MPFNWGFIGPEGSGKSIGMTYLDVLHLAKNGQVATFPGYNIYLRQERDSEGQRILLSHPVTMEQMIMTPIENFRGHIVSIDEIDNFMDSSRSMSMFNLLMSYIAKQRRKSGMGFNYTIQEWGDLYYRMRNKTHLLTLCWDLYWSPWGKDRKLERGEIIRWVTFDCLGFFTGKPWSQLKTKLLTAKPIREYYDTFAAVDIFEGMKKFEIIKPTTRIDLRPGQLEEEPLSPKDEVEHREMDRRIMDDLIEQGVSPKTMGVLHKRLARDKSL